MESRILTSLGWMAPYFIGARVAWMASPEWYGIIQALGLGGSILSAIFLFVLPNSTSVRDHHRRAFGPWFVADIAVFVLARSVERRICGDASRSY